MAHRTWKVGETKNNDKQVTCYFVTDAYDNTDIRVRPHAAEFPISQVFDEDTQWQRAERFAEYMNKLDEAARVASEQIHLLDILRK